MNIPNKIAIQQAYQRIKPYVNETPVESSESINSILRCKAFLKCENFQKTGAFKLRGAINRILTLPKQIKGVCTHSSGNHGHSLAYASNMMKIPCYVVMPKNATEFKKNAVKAQNAFVIESGNSEAQRQHAAQKIKKQLGLEFVHPANDLIIIQGAATLAYQFFGQLNKHNIQLDYLVFPIGGGGLASGMCLSTTYFSPKTKKIGVEPELARDAYLSLKSGKLQKQLPPKTIADGLRIGLGDKTFEIIKNNIDDIILVTDEQILDAMQLIFEKMKIVIESSSATVIAAVRKDPRFVNKNVGCIFSGGNVDFKIFFNSLRSSL